MRWIALVALVSLSATAETGFFRHPESPAHERVEAPALASVVCTLVLRYNTDSAFAQEMTYEGPMNLCISGFRTAITVASGASKVLGPRDPFVDGPPYECAALVSFVPGAASTPTVSALGGDACGAMVQSVLLIAHQNVLCAFTGVACAH